MRRRDFIGLWLAMLTVAPASAADAVQQRRRIGFLAAERARRTVIAALGEMGYVEGQNVEFVTRSIDPPERLPEFAGELVRSNVEVIVCGGALAVRAGQQATREIPIVMASGGDPLRSGFVGSLARPGGNTTGLGTQNVSLNGKRLELLKDAVPRLSRVAVLWSGDSVEQGQVREAQAAAVPLRLKLDFYGARAAGDLERAFAAIADSHPDGLDVLSFPVMTDYAAPIAAFALAQRLPSVFHQSDFPRAGGLMSYGQNIDEMLRRAAVYVDKILRGARPADLPVEEATRIEMVVNLATARMLGLTIPPSVLARADEVIE